MITALKALFEAPAKETEEALNYRLQVACAALLIETARADFEESGDERDILQSLLCNTLGVTITDIEPLLTHAEQRADAATSLYEFTRLINDHYSPRQKLKLISNMWRVAYADTRIDKHEDHLIRRVAELIHVSHQDFIATKLAAKKVATKIV